MHYLGIRIRHIYAVAVMPVFATRNDGLAGSNKEGAHYCWWLYVEESSVCECVAAEGKNKSASPSSPSGRSYLFADIPPGTKNNNTLYTTVTFFRIESSEVTRALSRVFLPQLATVHLAKERHAFSRRGNKNRATFPGSPLLTPPHARRKLGRISFFQFPECEKREERRSGSHFFPPPKRRRRRRWSQNSFQRHSFLFLPGKNRAFKAREFLFKSARGGADTFKEECSRFANNCPEQTAKTWTLNSTARIFSLLKH